jgi:broad specificity phosphatase PhoE
MATTILLIRHGQTDWNASGRWQGHLDIPLNSRGIAQSEALGRRLSGRPVIALYSSDLQRAAMTAAILGRALDVIPIMDPTWRERHGGSFQGLTFAEVRETYPAEFEAMRISGAAPPGGESDATLFRRVLEGYDRLVRRHHDEMVAVVSHGGTLNALISSILGFPAGQRARITLRGNTGLSTVEADEHGVRLVGLNDISHLEPWSPFWSGAGAQPSP